MFRYRVLGHHSSHHYVAKPLTSQTNLMFFVNNVLYKRKLIIGGYRTDQGCLVLWMLKASRWLVTFNEWIETCKRYEWMYRWMDVCTNVCFKWMKRSRRGLCIPLPSPLFRRMVSSGSLTCNKVEALIFSELLVSCALYDCLLSFVSPWWHAIREAILWIRLVLKKNSMPQSACNSFHNNHIHDVVWLWVPYNFSKLF